MNYILYNNGIIERVNAINIEDRAYQFGDGVYEVIGVYSGNPLLMNEHLTRLERSAKETQIKLPFTQSELKLKLEKLIEANQLYEGIIYLQVSRGAAPRFHEFPLKETSPITIAYTREEERMTGVENHGAKAVLAEDIRWHRCDIKSLNLLPNVLAKQLAVENDAVETILHRNNIITEASASNVFIVKDNGVYTHPVNNYILNGITRQKVIQLCGKLNLRVNEQTFTVEDLLSADEIFVTATKSDIIPITQIGDYDIGNGQPGEITKEVLKSFRKFIVSVENKSKSSLTD